MRRMLRFMDCYASGEVISDQNNNNNNSDSDDNALKNEFYAYCQSLFDTRIKQFTQRTLDRNSDSFGYNQTWLNVSELQRISDRSRTPDLQPRLTAMLEHKSVNSVHFTPHLITIVVDGETLQRFKKMTVSDNPIAVGSVFEIAVPVSDNKNEQPMVFAFDVQLDMGDESHPSQCGCYLTLRRKPASHSCSFAIIYDLVCAQLEYESVNRHQTFLRIGECDGQPCFSNDTIPSLDSLTFSLCIRVVFPR